MSQNSLSTVIEYYTYNGTDQLLSCNGGGVDFLSVLLGFVLGIIFTLGAIGSGVAIAWFVNYKITRRLREDNPPSDYEAGLVRMHHFPSEAVKQAPGVLSAEVRIPFVTIFKPKSPNMQCQWFSIRYQ